MPAAAMSTCAGIKQGPSCPCATAAKLILRRIIAIATIAAAIAAIAQHASASSKAT